MPTVKLMEKMNRDHVIVDIHALMKKFPLMNGHRLWRNVRFRDENDRDILFPTNAKLAIDFSLFFLYNRKCLTNLFGM
ncbi:hypothetical protein GD3902_16165 [Geobacillus thermodenitrificans]|nr:hypothetical protein GD3902_16165 [Geobacillus thermodenitrificans]